MANQDNENEKLIALREVARQLSFTKDCLFKLNDHLGSLIEGINTSSTSQDRHSTRMYYLTWALVAASAIQALTLLSELFFTG